MTSPLDTERPPYDDDELDAARIGLVQGKGPAEIRSYAGHLRAKAAAHRSYADRLDSHADALYRSLARQEVTR